MWPFSSNKSGAGPSQPSGSEFVGQSAAAGPSTTTPPQAQAAAAPPAAPSSPYGDFTTTPAPSTADIFNNPALSLDLAKLHPMAGLGKEDIEYLDIVDEQPSTLEGARTALPSRGWSDDLCYGTGTTYLSGLALGGLLGAREGLTRPLGVDNPTARLRLNAILNSVTRRGSFFGNSAGVIGEYSAPDA